MITLSARRPIFAPVASFSWTDAAETGLRGLLIVAAAAGAVIFVIQSF